MQASRIRTLLAAPTPAADRVRIQGWVRTRRDSKGGFSFLEINDGSCQANLQVIANKDLPNYESEIILLGTGASVEIEGKLVATEGRQQSVEMQADSVKMHGQADPSFPLQKKRHSFDYLRTIAHLRGRTNTFGAVMRIRSALSFAVHEFFAQQGFVYLHTPIITGTDAEGAGEMFQVTTFDLDKPIPRNDSGAIDYTQDFFARRTSLTVSGQLEGETYALALGNVYTFGPTFRAENSNTTRHLAEFWMIEPEMAFADLTRNADVAEQFLKHTISAVLTRCAEDIAFLDKFVQEGLKANLEQCIAAPFERMTYTEAVDILRASKKKFEFEPKWGVGLQTEHERFLTEEHLKKPVILTDYPKGSTAFYMRVNEDDTTVRAMDVLVPQIGEIIGGSQREERYDVLVERMKAAGLNAEEYSWYLDLRKYGSVPHSGFGLGFERLVLLVTGMQNIRDVIPYPRTPKHAEF